MSNFQIWPWWDLLASHQLRLLDFLLPSCGHVSKASGKPRFTLCEALSTPKTWWLCFSIDEKSQCSRSAHASAHARGVVRIGTLDPEVPMRRTRRYLAGTSDGSISQSQSSTLTQAPGFLLISSSHKKMFFPQLPQGRVFRCFPK